jgi:hypothetical protein
VHLTITVLKRTRKNTEVKERIEQYPLDLQELFQGLTVPILCILTILIVQGVQKVSEHLTITIPKKKRKNTEVKERIEQYPLDLHDLFQSELCLY